MPQPIQLLIVEDNPLDAELVLRELRRAGFEPEWKRVDTEEDFLEQLHAGLEIILSDYKMPLFDGFRALELLKGCGLDIPFIIVSGTIGEDVAVEAMKTGAADYLLKDRLARLGPAVSLALEQSRLRSDRRLVRETLVLREEALFEVSQGVLICDENRLAIYANEGFTRLTGYEQSDILGGNCSILQGPETDPGTILKMRAALNAGKPFECEILNYRKDGTVFWNDLTLSVIRNESGGPIRFVGIQRDVTERKRVEEALQWKTAFFEAQVDCALDGILVVGCDGKKILQNHRLIELWKIPPHISEEEDGDEQVRFVTEQTKNPRRFLERVEYLSSHPDEVSRDEIELLDGTMLDRYSAPVRDKAGKYFGRIWTFRDVTAEREREKRLSEALLREKELVCEARAGERAKGEFLAVMSHEIRTPMNGILGFSEMLAGIPNLSAEGRDYAKIISTCSEALLHILDDILNFSQMEAGGLKIEMALLSPCEILRDIHHILSPKAREKHLEFQLAVDEGVAGSLWNDTGRLRQVLLNIVGNAIKFTSSGSITLGLRAARQASKTGEPCVEIFVQDTGSGIPKDELDHIFEAFAQADSSISRRFGGTGLGLSISRNLVQLMGGTLTVTSEMGEGSEFIITLPLGLPAGIDPVVPDSTGRTLDASFAKNHPLTILVVEDDPVNLKLTGLTLLKLGYETLSATNGAEAVEIFRRERPDFIFMDLQMPQKDGIQATIEIRALESSRPSLDRSYIAALTANISGEARLHCFKVGMDSYLNKPLKPSQFAEVLQQAGILKLLRAQ